MRGIRSKLPGKFGNPGSSVKAWRGGVRIYIELNFIDPIGRLAVFEIERGREREREGAREGEGGREWP